MRRQRQARRRRRGAAPRSSPRMRSSRSPRSRRSRLERFRTREWCSAAPDPQTRGPPPRPAQKGWARPARTGRVPPAQTERVPQAPRTQLPAVRLARRTCQSAAAAAAAEPQKAIQRPRHRTAGWARQIQTARQRSSWRGRKCGMPRWRRQTQPRTFAGPFAVRVMHQAAP
jgi:hypothetical protein